MERGNTTHSPRVDDELAHETDSLTHGAPVESHAEEFKLQEPSGEDEPDVSAFPAGHEDDGSPGLSAAQIEARSELARALPRSAFPGETAALVATAEANAAREAVLEQLRGLPHGRVYAELGEVWHDLGGPDESDLLPGGRS